MTVNVFEMFLVYLYRKRWLIIVNFLIACVAASVYTFTIVKKEYSAAVTFLPPFGETFSAMSLLNLSMPSMSSGSASADQIEVIFGSSAIKRRIIDEFDFVEYFELEASPNKFGLASKRLEKYVMLHISEKGGGLGLGGKPVSYSVVCYHRSPDTARIMADFTFAIMDSAVREISIDKAQRNRMFIESQVAVQNEKMDTLQTVFLEFQNINKAYNVPEQAKLALSAYADLRAAALMNELKLSLLQSNFSGATNEMAELKRNKRVYDAKLREYEAGRTPDVIPSLDMATRLYPEYAKMIRDIEVQNQLILFLTKELEQAKLQESKDVSPLIIVDPAFVPEYKARPKRAFVLAAVVAAEHLFFLGFLTYFFFAKHVLAGSSRFSNFVKSIKQG